MRTTSLSLLVAVLVLTACATPRASPGDTPRDGDPAPVLELTATDGTTFALARASTKGPVVLVFYRGRF